MASGGSGSTSKGNGASKRMGNPRCKARRQECRARGEKRKQARRTEGEQAAARNAELRSAGQPTPWEAARLARVAKRAQRFAARQAAQQQGVA